MSKFKHFLFLRLSPFLKALIRFVGPREQLDRYELWDDDFIGLYYVGLLLSKVSNDNCDVFFAAYRLLRELDDVVDHGNPYDGYHVVSKAMTVLEKGKFKQSTGSKSVDISLRRFFECNNKKLIEQFSRQMWIVASTFCDDALIAMSPRLLMEAELRLRNRRLFIPCYQMLMYTLGLGEFKYGKQFIELCWYHSCYGHISDYKQDLRSKIPQIPCEMLSKYGVESYGDVQEDYPSVVRRAFIRVALKGMITHVHGILLTNLPFFFRLAGFIYMATRPLKYIIFRGHLQVDE